MERPAADSAVLARLGIAGTVPLAGLPERRLGEPRACIGVAGAPRIGHRHYRRGRNHALYACRIRRCRAIPGREHGHGLRHDAQTGIAARRIAAVAAAAGIGYRTDLRPNGNRRDGDREPVRPAGTWRNARHRCGQPGSDRGAERTVPADRVLPAAGAGGRYGASCARPKTEKRFHRLAGGARYGAKPAANMR